MEEKLSRGQRIFHWWSDRWAETLIYVLQVGFAISFVCFTDEFIKFASASDNPSDALKFRYKFLSVIGAVVSGITLISLQIHTNRKQPRVSELQRQNRQLNDDIEGVVQDMRAVITGYLWGISSDLKFNSADRMTVYGYDDILRCFQPLSRIAQNPQFKRLGRTAYPEDEGFIGKAWSDGEFFISDIPDWDTDRSGYIKVATQHNFPKSLHKQLKMKSRCYFGWRINDSNDKEPLAVLMLESLDPKRWTEDELRQYFSQQKAKFCSIFERAHRHLPESSEAAKRGL